MDGEGSDSDYSGYGISYEPDIGSDYLGWEEDFDLNYEDWYVEPEVPIWSTDETHSYSTRVKMLLISYNIILNLFKLVSNLAKWAYFKWVFTVVNVIIEVCQAVVTQENSLGKISTPFYLKLSVITSGFCLMISIIEIVSEAKESEVVWVKRGYWGWFFYPEIGRQMRVFGRFALYFGVVSSTVQFCINFVALVIKKNYVKFDSLPLMLSSSYLVAALVDKGEKPMIKCDIHGRSVVECPHCNMDSSLDPFI